MFLDKLAQLLLEQHGSDLHRVLVLLPGRRAGLHLRKYLARHHGGALWSPQLVDPAVFMEIVSGWKQAPAAESMLTLHHCHRELAREQAEPLAAFLQWAPTTLRDFSAADAHLLDLDKLYRDLREYHEIEEWSLRDLGTPSASQQRILHHWQSTGQLHRLFSERVAANRVGPYGAIARAAAGIAKDPAWQPPWDMVWAAGLNAIDPASLEVLQALNRRGLLRTAWDADRFYLDNHDHEAGVFLRRGMASLGPGEITAGNAIREKEREIESIELTDSAAMVRYAAQWAAALPSEQRDQSAIILADEQLLLPLLEVLPSDLGPLNVSLGIAVNELPVHSLVRRYLRLDSSGPLRTSDLVSLITHPMLHQGPVTEALVRALQEKGWPSWEREAAQRILRESALPPSALLAILSSHTEPHARIQALLAWAGEASRSDALSREQLFLVAEQERALHSALLRHGVAAATLREHHELRDRLLAEARLTLFGEPLRGLQVLGVLEARAIDFEQVLVLGASEGVLAGREEPPSWIPFELRRFLGLPLAGESEAIASYHVHRLLHGARRILLAHAPSADGSGAPARYVEQWRHELAHGSRTRVHHRSILARIRPFAPAGIAIQKDEATLLSLRAMLDRGISPSALSTWMRCPQDFHARYILGIRDEAAARDELGDDALGRAVHAAAEALYRPWLGRALTPAELRTAASAAEASVARALASEFPAHLLNSGSHLVRSSMAAQALRQSLLTEAEACETSVIVPISVEAELRAELRPGVNILGKADRIQRCDGVIRIIDMKTGGVNPRHLDLDGLERDAIDADSAQALQLLMYAAMALHMDKDLRDVQAGIVPLRKPSVAEEAWLSIQGDRTIKREQLPAIDALLLSLIDELIDPAIPFAHNAESEWCTCCVA